MAEPRLLIVGQSNMELDLRLPRFPAAGETLKSDGVFRFSPGGRAGQAAACTAKLGIDTLLCTRIGNDLNGRTLKNFYDACGVDTRFVKADKNRPTALCQTITEQEGRTRSILFPGATGALTDEDLEDAFSAFPDGLLISFDCGDFLFRRACALAAELGIPVFADGMRPDFEYPMTMPRLEAIVLGEAETYAYTDIYPDCLDNYVRACIRLNAKINSRYFIIRLKGRGTFLTDGKYSEIISLPDTAGEMAEKPDVFTAALAAEMIAGESVRNAVKIAGVVSAYISLNRGNADPYPTREQLADFCKNYGIR
ncbi:MAG: hypothetical protein IKT43_03740 [Clostridia bacterium]|nr:hypothetical protein [Clostridia bacterium]